MSVQSIERPVIVPTPKVMDGDAQNFRENFNRASFEFAHHLAGHPLFELPRLLELAKGLPDADAYYDAGDIRVDQRWDQIPRTQLSVDQLLDRIENAGAWILLRGAHKDPRYAALLDQSLGEVRSLVGAAFPRKIKCVRGLVFITSPNRVTTYHMDRECNYLLQIHGDKVMYVFDRYDREVLPEKEIERFWSADNNAAVYKEQYQARGREYHMRPGVGVHIPVNAPHWLKNGDNISVTLAITFQFMDMRLPNIYRTNYFLRKAGLRPLPPGQSKVRDALKAWTMGGAIGARNVFRRVLGADGQRATTQDRADNRIQTVGRRGRRRGGAGNTGRTAPRIWALVNHWRHDAAKTNRLADSHSHDGWPPARLRALCAAGI